MGLEISKSYSSYSFHPMPAKLYEDIGYHGGIQAITVLGNPPSQKHIATLCSFNMGVNGKIMKCAIFTADRRPKRMNVWDAQSKKLHLQGTFQVRSFEFSLGFFGALSKISNYVKFIKTLLLPQFSSIVQTLQTACILFNFSGYLPNFKSIWLFEDKLPQLDCQCP